MSVQLKCGELKSFKNADGKCAGYQGKVRLIGRLAGDLKLTPHEMAGKNANAPDYEVFYKDQAGTAYPIGAAWFKNNERGDFLSLSVGHPDWSGDVSLAAYPDDDGTFRLVWSRPRGPAKAADQEAA